MPKITKREKQDREQVVIKSTKPKVESVKRWWAAASKAQRSAELLESASFLKEMQQYKYRQASMYSRLYSNMPMFGIMGGSSAMYQSAPQSQLPLDRPTMNVVQSCVDTLVSRLSQSRHRPRFLTDAADYKERKLSKQMNQFIDGELYQTKAYELSRLILRDACVLGTGCVKIYEEGDKVKLSRTLMTELLVDANDAMYGEPRMMIQLALVDRSVLAAAFPEKKSTVERAEQAFFTNMADSNKTMSDQVMVVEGWHLPSGKDADDGLHMICLTSGELLEEKWEKPTFPFVFLHFSPRMLGFWGQGLAEQLMGTQMEINKLLMTISASINLVGVPRVFVQDGSKVVKAHLNNQIGSIVTYQGTKPEYSVAPCVPQEIYAQLQRLIDYAYQQSGISAMAAASKKPAGLDSGAAIREFDDLQSDRFADLEQRVQEMFVELAHQIIGKAVDIAEETGKYQTVYPNKDGTREIELPKFPSLLDNPFVIQCFDSSALPRDPAGRMSKVAEMIQAGMVDIREGRRMLGFPDLEQIERLDNASEERIFQILDEIVESGKYTPPDPFMDLELAKKLSVQYYNLYVAAKLTEDRAEMLRTFNAQVLALQQAAMPPAPMGAPAPGGPVQAVPEAPPVSPLLPRQAAA